MVWTNDTLCRHPSVVAFPWRLPVMVSLLLPRQIHSDQKQLGGGKSLFGLQFHVTTHLQGQELKKEPEQKTQWKVANWLILSSSASPICLGDGTTYIS